MGGGNVRFSGRENVRGNKSGGMSGGNVHADLIYCYKVVFALTDLQASDFFRESPPSRPLETHKLYKRSVGRLQLIHVFLVNVLLIVGINYSIALIIVPLQVLSAPRNLLICQDYLRCFWQRVLHVHINVCSLILSIFRGKC